MDTVNMLVEQAGSPLDILVDHVQLIRNAGAQIDGFRKFYALQDRHQLIVYLKCAKKHQAHKLIVRLPICEDLDVKLMQVRVEVPETDDIFVVEATSNETISLVIGRTPVPAFTIAKITYNGVRVNMDQSLDQLHFANKSALIVYLTPSASNDRLAVTQPTLPEYVPPEMVPNNEQIIPDNSQSGSIPPIPIPVDESGDPDWPRAPMMAPAVVTVHVDDRAHLDFPVLVHPTDVGLVFFEAVKDRIGKPFANVNLKFKVVMIEQGTELKPLGFRDGDVVLAQILP
jgi:hypothetical protein